MLQALIEEAKKQVRKILYVLYFGNFVFIAQLACCILAYLNDYSTYFYSYCSLFLLERIIWALYCAKQKTWLYFLFDTFQIYALFYMQKKQMVNMGHIFTVKTLFQFFIIFFEVVFLFGFGFIFDSKINIIIAICIYAAFLANLASFIISFLLASSISTQRNVITLQNIIRYGISLSANAFTVLAIYYYAYYFNQYYFFFFVGQILFTLIPLILQFHGNTRKYQYFQEVIEPFGYIMLLNDYFHAFQSTYCEEIFNKWIRVLSYLNTLIKFGFAVNFCYLNTEFQDNLKNISDLPSHKYIEIVIMMITIIISIEYLYYNFKEFIHFAFQHKSIVIHRPESMQPYIRYLLQKHRFLKRIFIGISYHFDIGESKKQRNDNELPLIQKSGFCDENCKNTYCFITGTLQQAKYKVEVEVKHHPLRLGLCRCFIEELFSNHEEYYLKEIQKYEITDIFSRNFELQKKIVIQRYFSGFLENSFTKQLELAEYYPQRQKQLAVYKQEFLQIYAFSLKISSLLHYSPSYTLIDLYCS